MVKPLLRTLNHRVLTLWGPGSKSRFLHFKDSEVQRFEMKRHPGHFSFVSRFQFQKNLRRLVSQLYIRDNCHPFKASVLVWVQLPLWLSLSLALRNLSLDQSGKLAQTLSWTELALVWSLLRANCVLCSGADWFGIRGHSVVPGPDLPRLHLDTAHLSWTHQPLHHRGQCRVSQWGHLTRWCHQPCSCCSGFFSAETQPISSWEVHNKLHAVFFSLDGSRRCFSALCEL